MGLAASPELKACYQLKEGFRNWFNQQVDRLRAEQDLLAWMQRVDKIHGGRYSHRELLLRF